jgi:4-amino-4-deoxy-L-arabinose transferase-like glycosyltransferase
VGALTDPAARRQAVVILTLAGLVKLAIAMTFPLGVDEAYAIAAARVFSWSFYDHPPLSFWAPVWSAQVFGESALAYRLPSLVCGLVTGAVLWKIARDLGGLRAGLWTVILWSLAPHMVFGSGLFVLPDAVLNMGGALAALALVRLVRDPSAGLGTWALGGVGLAIALGSKYQAGLIPFGVLSFMAVTGRWGWFARPGFWLATVLALTGLAPVILWNLSTDWASFAFHGSRTARSLQPVNFAVMLAGQMVYLLPATFVLALLAAVRALRGADGEKVLAHLALWPIVVFNLIFLVSDASFPHWSLPGFVFALPLAGLWLSRAPARGWRWALGISAVPLWALALAIVVHAPGGLLTRGSDPLPGWDNTIDVFDWSGLAPALQAAGALDGVEVVAAESWIEAGQMGTGLAQGLGQALPMAVLGDTPHHFAFHPAPDSGARALYLAPGRLGETDAEAVLARVRTIAPDAQALGTLVLPRGTTPYAAVVVVGFDWP